MPNIWLSKINNYYYDINDPIADVKKQLEALKLKNTRMAIFLGLGLGYELLYYIQNLSIIQRTNHILVIEKDLYLFREALKSADFTEVFAHEGITFIVGVDEKDLYPLLRSYLKEKNRFIFLKTMKPVYHISSLRLNKEYYLSAFKTFREAAVHEVLNYGDAPHDSLIGVENMLSNIKEIVSNPGINLLYDKFKNKPAVVVSTGPSLNKNKHLLKGLENKALIVAADASLKIMLEMGVKPHLVTSLERVMPIVKLLEGFTTEQLNDVYLAACPVVRPEVYSVYKGPRIIVYRDFNHFKWVGIDKGILQIQLSAGNMAFKVAEALGCDPIILIGQDLSFSRDGYTHASGAVYGVNQGNEQQETFEVLGNDGEMIRTTKTWYSFLKGYELDLASYKGTCVNSTEGGAYINGTKVMPFKDAIDKYIHEDIYPLQIIKQNIAEFTDTNIKNDINKVYNTTQKTIEDLEAMATHCNKGINVINKYRETLEGIINKTSSDYNLNKMEKEILEPKSTFFSDTFELFLAHIVQSYIIKFEMEILAVPEKYEDKSQATAEALLMHAEFYNVIVGLINKCIDSLNKAKEILLNNI